MEKTKVLESAGSFQVQCVSAGSAAASWEPTTTASPSCTMAPVREPHSGAKTPPAAREPQPRHGDPGMEEAEVEGLVQPLKWRRLVLLQPCVLLKQGPGVCGAA